VKKRTLFLLNILSYSFESIAMIINRFDPSSRDRDDPFSSQSRAPLGEAPDLSDFRWFFLLWGRGHPEGAWQGGTPAEWDAFLRAQGQAAALAARTHAALSGFKGSTRILQSAR